MKSTKSHLLLVGTGLAIAYVLCARVEAEPPLTAEQLTALQPIDSSSVPENGTFWLLKGHNPDASTPPMPMMPTELSGMDLPVYSLGGGAFLVDDSSVDYDALEFEQDLLGMDSMSMNLNSMSEIPLPDPDGGGDGSGSSDPPPAPMSYPEGSLWLSMVNTQDPLYGPLAALTLNGTTNGTWYEVLSKRGLEEGNWHSEGSLQGFTNESASLASITATAPTSLFLIARSLTNGSGDTLPLWWQLENFGRTGLDPLSDPSAQGNTLLDCYLDGLEPNIIRFSLTATNNYILANPATLQLSVLAGVPFKSAVLVDSTNFAEATWSPLASTNTIEIGLGVQEGWHSVWVGLKGFSPGSYEAWQWKWLKVDRTLPQLSLLNPAQGLVTQPTIQIVGTCPEALGAIWYDLSNSLGTLSGEQVFVTQQSLDANTWEFTSNTFQAFDVDLAPGTNIVYLHALDLAGNETATNLTFVLDLSAKTNAPSLQLLWPQNGEEISANTFTLRGLCDDPTAAIQAQLTNSAGHVQIVHGFVERNGGAWIDNIPLSPGTNTVAVQVSDGAGNSTRTNITVMMSSVVMKMNPVQPRSLLWEPAIPVSGTINDPAYAIWVNGVKGRNHGDGTWSATNVPVSQGGAAVFRMVGFAPNQQQPDGSYGN